MGQHISEVQQDERYPFDIFDIGDHVAMKAYTDIHPGTVVKVSPNGKTVHVQHDDSALDPSWKPNIEPGGFAGHCTNQHEQKWTFIRNTEGRITKYSLRKWRGRYVWTPTGTDPDGHQRITKGWRRFHDYNF